MAARDTIIPRTGFDERRRAARTAVFASQRERMLEAMVAAVAEKGYHATTVADVAERARVSRRTFYEQFEDKDACFLAAFDIGAEYLTGLIASESEAATNQDDWRGMVRGLLETYLRTLAAEPDFARMTHVDALTANPYSMQRRTGAHDAFVIAYRRFNEIARAQDPTVPALTDEALEVLVGGIAEYTRLAIVRGNVEHLADHADALVAFAQSVIGGAAATGNGKRPRRAA